MGNEITRIETYYKINFFQPKTNQDKNVGKKPIIIPEEAYKLIKDDLINNKRIEINGELYNPYTIDTVKKHKIEESVSVILSNQDVRIQKKVKEYMQFEKKTTTIKRLENMIQKAKDELFNK